MPALVERARPGLPWSTMQPSSRGIALLLSIGSLPIACGKGEKGSEGDDSTAAGTGSTGTSDAMTGPGGSTTSGAEGSTSPTSVDVTDTDATEPQPTSSTSDDPETGEPIPGPICEAYAAHYVECYPRYARYGADKAASCAFYRDLAVGFDGPVCGEAYDAFLVCLTMTPCADFDNEPPDLPCPAESQAQVDACPGTSP